MKEIKTVKLSNGVEVPEIGFGTWKAPLAQTTIDAVVNAMECDYVGMGIKEGMKRTGYKREDLFVTSKLWNTVRGYQETLDAFEESRGNLDLDYVDLYMMHWPVPNTFKENYVEKNIETWRAMERLYLDGKCRAIGISNFKVHHVNEIMQGATIKPLVNQIEFHPGCGVALNDDIKYCQDLGILVTGYSPLANGDVFKYQHMNDIAERVGASVAQVCMQYCVQRGVLPIFKSVKKERIIQNITLDFTINDEDMKILDAMTEPGLLNDSDNTTFSETAPVVFE